MKKIKLVFTLGVIALLAGCSNILNAPEGPAPKTGTVTLTVGQGSGARTVFPSIAQFDEVKLTFAGSPAVADVDVIGGVATINLLVGGPWTVVAEAYIDGVLAAHSTAVNTLAWSGTGDVSVSGGTRFVLEPTDVSGYGTLRGVVRPPVGITLGAGSRITITELSGPSVVFEQELTEGMEGDMPLAEGRYYVDVVLENEDGSATAVYHRTVAILSGLRTEVQFEPGTADFLSEEVRAVMVSVENLVFGVTADEVETNAAGIVVETEDFVNGNISISAPNGTDTVYFVVNNPDGLTLNAVNAVKIGDGITVEGSVAGPTLSVFEVDTSSVAGENGGEVIVAIDATEEGREAIPITVTVTVDPMAFGLFVDNAGDLERVDYPVANLNDCFDWLQLYAEDDTSYVIQLDKDDGITHYESRAGVSNVTVTLRGLFKEQTVTYDGNYIGPTLSPNDNGLIYIRSGTTFVLDEHITLDAQNTELYDSSNNGRSLVSVAGGKFRMISGSKMTGSISRFGAVYADGAYSEFIMEGGEICGNANGFYMSGVYDAAVIIATNAAFRMLNGKISDNQYRGVLTRSGAFAMEGGEISGNGTERNLVGAGIAVTGSSSFTMTGGQIINNGSSGAASGIYAGERYAAVTLNGPVTISGNSVNVWAYSAATFGPITLGPNFVNKSSPIPIVVDVTGRSNHSLATIISNVVSASKYFLLGSSAAIAEFVPGVVAHTTHTSDSSDIFSPQPSSFIISDTGTISIVE
jgi:hypothetical protein